MTKCAWILPVAVAFGAFSGCTCGSKESAPASPPSASAPPPEAAPPPASAPRGPGDARSEAKYSAPIAAARMSGGSVAVAALVAGDKTIVVTTFGADGAIEWTREVFRGVTWSPEVELRVLPASDGAAVVWRGAVDGKIARWLVVLDAKGEPRGKPVEVGSALCSTLDGLAWIDRAGAEPVRVQMRGWSDAEPHELGRVAAEPAPTLECGEHRVHVLVASEDELSVTTLPASDGGVPVVVSRDKDFPDDGDADNQTFTFKDTLGVLRVAESGALAMRELEGATLGPWRKLKHRLSADDDVIVGVDGDATSLVVVYTHDQSELCKDPGASGKSLHALTIDRATATESRVLLAPADCGKETGPFWIGASARGFVVAWVERGKRSDPNTAPIRALHHRALVADGGATGAGTSAPPQRIEQAADALVDAGCDGVACWAVALVRDQGADGMAPEALRVMRYP